MADQTAPPAQTAWRPADVFISYKREEKEEVARLAEVLRGLGLNVWFDARLQSGESFDAEIDREVNAASCVLVCWSPGAIESHWVRSEASVGFSRHRLVAAVLEPVPRIPVPFNTVHAENLSDWRGEANHPGWGKVLEAVGVKVGRPGLSAWALARGAPSPQTLRDFVRDFPSDPAAPGVLSELEEGERRIFESALMDAQSRFEGQTAERRARFDAEVARLRAEFEGWLAAERAGRYAVKPNPASLRWDTPVAPAIARPEPLPLPPPPQLQPLLTPIPTLIPAPGAGWWSQLPSNARTAIIGAGLGGLALGLAFGYPMGVDAGRRAVAEITPISSAVPDSSSTPDMSAPPSIESNPVLGNWNKSSGSCPDAVRLSLYDSDSHLLYEAGTSFGTLTTNSHETVDTHDTSSINTSVGSSKYSYAFADGQMTYSWSSGSCVFTKAP